MAPIGPMAAPVVDDLSHAAGAPVGVSVAWNGHHTRLTLAHPVMRGASILGAGDSITVAAAYQATGVDGRTGAVLMGWLGDEAEWVRHVIAAGVIAGYPSAAQRARRQSVIDDERMVVLNADDDPETDAISLPSIQPRTADDLRRQWAPVLRGGEAAMKARERHLVTSELKELQAESTVAIQNLTAALTGALVGQQPEASPAQPVRSPKGTRRPAPDGEREVIRDDEELREL